MAEAENPAKKQNWFAKHKVWTVIIGLVVLGFIINASGNGQQGKNSSATSNTTSSRQPASAAKATPTPVPARQVTGKATTLGAGTFTGGKDVEAGLYDVIPGPGQSGNFMVDGTDSYNEILGNAGAAGGVPKIRVKISDGDTITISSLSQVVFTPVTAPFVTTHTTANLYAGTFVVGQDLGAGRYVATPGAGQSGNFIVTGNDSYDEILGGDSSMGGVPSLAVNLSDGDVIAISSLSQVTLTPAN